MMERRDSDVPMGFERTLDRNSVMLAFGVGEIVNIIVLAMEISNLLE